MAIFNITNNKGVAPPLNVVNISTLYADKCNLISAVIDNIAYHNGGNRLLEFGDTLYSDEALTILYNLSGIQRDYSSNITGNFIRLNDLSVHIPITCK